MPTRSKKSAGRARYFIIELKTFEGDDTAVYLMGADPTWIVIGASPTAGAHIADMGYRSLKEAVAAWPDAVVPARARRPRDRSRAVGWNGIPPVFAEPWFQSAWRREKVSRARR